ncbi:hypothetical protein BD779DRAFT_1467299 [Infundibulicybe gibba]|nr:hypothetical protein BD779DRAFT_1467299 [Infundibulicybe gibba]
MTAHTYMGRANSQGGIFGLFSSGGGLDTVQKGFYRSVTKISMGLQMDPASWADERERWQTSDIDNGAFESLGVKAGGGPGRGRRPHPQVIQRWQGPRLIERRAQQPEMQGSISSELRRLRLGGGAKYQSRGLDMQRSKETRNDPISARSDRRLHLWQDSATGSLGRTKLRLEDAKQKHPRRWRRTVLRYRTPITIACMNPRRRKQAGAAAPQGASSAACRMENNRLATAIPHAHGLDRAIWDRYYTLEESASTPSSRTPDSGVGLISGMPRGATSRSGAAPGAGETWIIVIIGHSQGRDRRSLSRIPARHYHSAGGEREEAMCWGSRGPVSQCTTSVVRGEIERRPRPYLPPCSLCMTEKRHKEHMIAVLAFPTALDPAQAELNSLVAGPLPIVGAIPGRDENTSFPYDATRQWRVAYIARRRPTWDMLFRLQLQARSKPKQRPTAEDPSRAPTRKAERT